MSVVKRLSGTAAAVLAVVLTAFAFAGSSGAAPYGGGATVSVSSGTVAPGGTVTVSASGFHRNQTVTLRLDTGVVLGTVNSGNGSWSTTVTIPAGTSLGSHTITATDAAGDTASVTVAVTAGAPSSTGGGGGVSVTGVAVIGIGALGALLIAGGAVLLYAGRRRRVTA